MEHFYFFVHVFSGSQFEFHSQESFQVVSLFVVLGGRSVGDVEEAKYGACKQGECIDGQGCHGEEGRCGPSHYFEWGVCVSFSKQLVGNDAKHYDGGCQGEDCGDGPLPTLMEVGF